MTHLIENDTDKKNSGLSPLQCLHLLPAAHGRDADDGSALPSDLALTDSLGLQGPLCWLVVCL